MHVLTGERGAGSAWSAWSWNGGTCIGRGEEETLLADRAGDAKGGECEPVTVIGEEIFK